MRLHRGCCDPLPLPPPAAAHAPPVCSALLPLPLSARLVERPRLAQPCSLLPAGPPRSASHAFAVQVMWMHLGQRSFPMTEEEYDEKMEMVALYLT